MTDLEFSPRHGFPCTPHIGVYGDNYAPFAPFLIVRGHYDTRDAALPSSSFLPPDVAAWASLDAEMLQEQEGAAVGCEDGDISNGNHHDNHHDNESPHKPHPLSYESFIAAVFPENITFDLHRRVVWMDRRLQSRSLQQVEYRINTV